MAQQTINIGTIANDGTGDPLRDAYDKANDNFTELYSQHAKTPINAQTGTSYTFVLGDAGKMVTLTNASAIAVTIPTNASVAFDVDTIINIASLGGVGTVTITGDTGVTVNGSSGGSVVLDGAYAGASIVKLATNTWLAIGKLA